MNTTPTSETPRWLGVDDNTETLRMLEAILLHMTKATVECHSSPHAALAAFAAAPDSYEVVITDFEMPGMNGVELCLQLRSISATQKVILATGNGFFSRTAARHAGFIALLNKPFPVASLSETLTTAGLMTAANGN